MQLLILAVVFFGLVFLIVAIYGLVNRESLEASEAAREQLRMGGGSAAAAINILRDDRSSEIPFLNKLLAGRALTESITELTGMEGEIITMQEIFRYHRRGIATDGTVIGGFESTGVRPTFMERLRLAGAEIPADLFAMR